MERKFYFNKFLLCVGLSVAFSTSQVKAQDQGKWGVMAGANVSSSSAKDVGWTMGGQIGALYHQPLSGSWAIQSRLQFSFTESRGKDNSPLQNALYNQWALSLPVMASYRIGLNTDMAVRLNAGPYLQYAFFGQSRQPLSPSQGRAFWHSTFGEKFTYGVQVGMELDYKKWLFSIDYKHSLRDNQNATSCDQGKERNWMFSIGYKL